MTTVTVPRFFDAHVHFRDGEVRKGVVPATARCCSRAVVMPNVPAVEDARAALDYQKRILRAAKYPDFTPLMTVKLTHRTTPALVREASAAGVVAAKVYPEGATTGSHDGVRDLRALAPVLAAMDDAAMVLCVHGEKPDVFVMDREVAYIPWVSWVLQEFPGLRVVMEHVTTACAVNFVARGPERLAATVTAHHLDLTLDDVIGRGVRPHLFCYPVAKRPEDRAQLRNAASGRLGPRFFLGSDSAPHLKADKESACGCAGVYSAPVLAEVLAGHFLGDGDAADPGAVARLADFTSRNGERFYGLTPAEGTLTLGRRPWAVPAVEPCGVVPYRAGEQLDWSLCDS